MTSDVSPSGTASKPPLGDTLRVVSAALWSSFVAVAKWILGRKTRPSWPLRLQAMVAAQKGTWTVMPTIGMVRWRAVGHALSPLLADGLPPKPIVIPSGEGELEAFWLEPPDGEDRVLLYFHGGGFVFGCIRTHGDMIGAFARASRARTLALEYRLAPEHPSPAALEDALTAYRWVLASGVPPEKIVFGGDSAGGNLVLTTLLALRDRGEALPAAGVAISPWVDLTNSGESFQRNLDADFVGKVHCDQAAGLYLKGQDATSPCISPLYADLTGLPPLLIHAGGAETLVDQIRGFVTRAKEAGVEVEYSEYEDMVHVWHMLRGFTPRAAQAIEEVGAYIQRRTN